MTGHYFQKTNLSLGDDGLYLLSKFVSPLLRSPKPRVGFVPAPPLWVGHSPPSSKMVELFSPLATTEESPTRRGKISGLYLML